MSFLPEADSPVEELKRVHLQCLVCLNALKTTLPSLKIAIYGKKVKEKYNAPRKRLTGNQLRSSVVNNSETDLRKTHHCSSTE